MHIQSALENKAVRSALVARGASQQMISNWKARNEIPQDWCPTVEQVSGGTYTCEAIRPELAWVRIKDKDWPNKAGRPLLDMASKPETITEPEAKTA